MLVLALWLTVAAAPDVTPTTPWPEKLGKPLVARVEFNWPKRDRFQDAWDHVSNAGLPLLRGHASKDESKHGDWYVAVPLEDGRWVLSPLHRDARQLVLRTITGETLSADGEDWVVDERLEAPVGAEALTSATYVGTLLTFNGPLYAVPSFHEVFRQIENDPSLTDEQRREKVRAALTARQGDEALRTLVNELEPAELHAWAQKHKRDDALFTKFRSYRPMGSCSMDTHPQAAARVFAELAYARGDLGRFLQLQINIMGDQFERTAWSSYGEASHDTEAERLASTGIELDTFLLGLNVATAQGHGARIDTWRLARSIREAGRADALVPVLATWAQQPKLDAYNRLRALQAWFYVQLPPSRGFRAEGEERKKYLDAVNVVVERGLKLELHAVSREWLEAQTR